VWRYSGIDAFDLEQYAPADPAAGAPGADGGSDLAAARALADRLGPRAALVVTRDGAVVAVEGDIGSGPLAVAAATDPGAGSAPERMGRLAPARDAFGELHDAFVADAVVVSVAPKAVVRDPVVVVHLTARDPRHDAASGAAGTAVFPHLSVHLGPAAEAGVVEILTASPAVGAQGPGAPALVVPVTELEVEDDAHLAYANVQVLPERCRQIAVQASRVGANATLRSFTVGLGGAYARVRTDSDLVGPGGRTALLAAYLGTGDQVHDFRTLQDHHSPHSESELLFKGAVADRARSVYSGLIRIRRGARRADARQSNHNLVLSEGAHADSVPNLDIDENDVRCSHASTVGPIDEEQRYYIESRGVEPEVAERLVVQGFFADLARRAPYQGLAQWVESAVVDRLAPALGAGGGRR
jgi:Fe-S cluster assembly protein SufD